MPLIDVNEVLTDPLIAAEVFTVIRRVQSVNTFGERTNTEQRIVARGSITPTGNNSMVREEGYQISSKTLKVITPFILRGPSVDQINRTFDPDIVLWRGDFYIVKTVEDYSQYGAGLVEAECISTNYSEQIPHNP